MAEYTAQLLAIMQDQAEARGGVATLGKPPSQPAFKSGGCVANVTSYQHVVTSFHIASSCFGLPQRPVQRHTCDAACQMYAVSLIGLTSMA